MQREIENTLRDQTSTTLNKTTSYNKRNKCVILWKVYVKKLQKDLRNLTSQIYLSLPITTVI